MPRVLSRLRRPASRLGPRPFLVLAAVCAATGAPLAAQVAPGRAFPDSIPSIPAAQGASPGGAFLRALLLPGWGHAAIGSYHRGAFYFVVEGAAAWNLLKVRRRFDQAQDRVRFREELLRRDLEAEGITDEEAIQEGLDADVTLRDLKGLEESRRQQREDWTALGIFLVFLSGADAYVSAHLRDFPVPLELNAQPAGGGRMELSVGFTLPR